MSGIVNIKLKEGRDRYEGSMKYSSDRLIADNFNSDRIEFNLGGPDLLSFKPFQLFQELTYQEDFHFSLMGMGKCMMGIFRSHQNYIHIAIGVHH